MIKHFKDKIEEKYSIYSIIAIMLIIISTSICFIRVIFFHVDFWAIIDNATINVICSAIIFLVFNANDAQRSSHLSRVINSKILKCIKEWDSVIHILERNTDERLHEINESDMTKFQSGTRVYANNRGEIEQPSYFKVLHTETKKLVIQMKEFQDNYFDFLNPEVVTIISEIQDSWNSSEILFNLMTDENDIVTNGDNKEQEKIIVFAIRQITERVKKINNTLHKSKERL